MVLRTMKTDIIKKNIRNIKYRGENIKESTAEGHYIKLLYVYRNVFNREIEDNKIEFKLFNRFNEVRTYLDVKYDNLETRRSYIVAVISVLKATKQHLRRGAETATYSKYRKYLLYLVNELNKFRKTPQYKQEKCAIPNSEINNKLNAMEQKYKKTGKTKFLQDVILIKLYTGISPVRADYVDMIITKQYIDRRADKNLNYADITNGLFYIHNHKNERANGTLQNKMTPEIRNLIAELYERRQESNEDNYKYLLLTTEGAIMTPNYLTKKIKRLTGCSINDLRKRYTKDNLGGKFKELNELNNEINAVAVNMGTSSEVLNEYYNKT